MAAIFHLTHQGTLYRFPVFKFLSSKNTVKLMNGNVHIPQLFDFQNEAKHGDTVHDAEEATVQLSNTYTHYNGLVKNANGLLAVRGGYPYEHIKFMEEINLSQPIAFKNSYGYCVTQHFFSNSVLHWAKDRKKEECVIIIDFEAFISRANAFMEKEHAQSLGVDRCAYVGRVIKELNPTADSLSNLILTENQRACFVKPVEHKDHNELRAVWLVPQADSYPTNFNFDIPEVSELCIRVDYSSIHDAVARNDTPKSFGAKIHKKSARTPSEYQILAPPEMCSPVLWQADDRWLFGLRLDPKVKNIVGARAENSMIGMMALGPPIGTIFCVEVLSDIAHIEFTCE